VSVYGSYFAARFRTLLQYRGAAIGGMVTQVFFGLITVMVYEAFYRSTTVAQPMTISQVRSYIWLGQAFLAMLPWNVEGEQRALVRSGAVAYELLRPVHLYSLWFARSIAWRTAPTLMRCIPILALAFAFFGLRLPPTPVASAAWAVSMACALLLSASMTTLLTILLMWTVSGEGLNIIFTALVILCSGMNIPVPLFPDWIRGVIEFLPFRGLVDSPYRLYVGYAHLADLPGLVVQQLGWSAAIILGSVFLMRRGLRRLSINGG
jgi:ABC-2 type transport system permease protein